MVRVKKWSLTPFSWSLFLLLCAIAVEADPLLLLFG